MLAALGACGGEPGPAVHPDATDGTRAMAARLAAQREALDPMLNDYRNTQRAEHWAREVLAAGGVEAAPKTSTLSWARELMLAGRPEESIELFDRVRASFGPRTNPQMLKDLRHMIGLAWLRLAEQQNCLEHHSIDSCLMPLEGGGVHVDQVAGQRAYELFREALEATPGGPANLKDWEALWLLNLAAMTIGQWPGGVPEAWRIDPEHFASDAELARFSDVAAEAGVNAVGLAGGVCMEDFDGDGLLDLLVSSWGLEDELRLFRNRGDGRFDERTEAMQLQGITGGLNMIHADPDNDGDADALVLRGAWFEREGGHPNSLLRNEGGLRFTDATEERGLLSFHPTQAAAWGDYDDDGWLDLFVGNETGPHEVHPCELFHNDGGRFQDVAPRLGLALEGYVKGVAWGDPDNDGDLDLYVSRINGTNWLIRNDGARRPADVRAPDPGPGPGPGPEAAPTRGAAAPVQGWRFTDISAAAGIAEPVRSFPTWFFDADNDGWQDLFVSGYRWGSAGLVAKDYLGLKGKGIKAHLYRNLGAGDGRFEDVSEAAGVARVLNTMGANFGDLDNDGFPDMYCATGEPDFAAVYPNRMFLGDGRGGFLDVTTAGGFGHVQKGHGIAFGDLDQDGDQDVYAVMGGAYEGDVFPNALFRNPGHGRRWLTLRLEGVQANRSAIGARLRVTIEQPNGDTRDIHATVGTGGSFGSSSLQQELGLGDATAIRELEVRWPGSGRVQRLQGVPLDRIVAIREGDQPVVLPSEPFRLGD